MSGAASKLVDSIFERLDRPVLLLFTDRMSETSVAMLRQYLQQQVALGELRALLRPTAKTALVRLSKGGGVPRAESPLRSAPCPVAKETRLETKEPGTLDVAGSSKAERLANLARMAGEASGPRALGSLRTSLVFATGNPDAKIMFIGEAPGAEEEKQKEPFVGPSGQLLTKIITAMGLQRADVYISNICKFRPAMPDQGTGNRQPTAEEMKSCLPFIHTEIDVVSPSVIIALGATACAGLGIEGPVGKNRGRVHQVRGFPVVVTYHPSYLLRQEQEGRGLEAKRQSWEDVLLAMATAQLPINEKQRNYFKPRL